MIFNKDNITDIARMTLQSYNPGVLTFGLDGGVPFEPRNPYPFLRVILAEKGTHFRHFKDLCKNTGPFYTQKYWKF